MIETLKTFINGLLPALGLLAGGYIFLWFKKIKSQEKRNAINEIDLAAKKINLDNQSKPISDLVADSNKSHGVPEVGKSTGSDDNKG